MESLKVLSHRTSSLKCSAIAYSGSWSTTEASCVRITFLTNPPYTHLRMTCTDNMEKSQELVRTISRSFFPPSHTIIIEALLHHSALTLAEVRSFFASGGRPKSELSSWLAELERGGLVSKYVRAEQRRANRSQQKQGAGGTVYYYIDYRKAVDASNYRLHSLEQKCTKHSNPSAADEKSCQCTTCKTEYTQLKLMESRDLLGRGSGFKVCLRQEELALSRPNRA